MSEETTEHDPETCPGSPPCEGPCREAPPGCACLWPDECPSCGLCRDCYGMAGCDCDDSEDGARDDGDDRCPHGFDQFDDCPECDAGLLVHEGESMTTPTRPPLEEMRARVEAATPERHLCERCTKGAHTHIGGSCVLCPCQHPLDCRCGGCEDGRAAARAVVADLPAALDWIAHLEGLLARAVLRVELMPNHGADCGYWASSAGSRTCTCGGNGLAADIRAALGGGR